MGDPDALLDAVVEKLRAIPAVVAMVGDLAANITAYQDQGSSLLDFVYEMAQPAILVALDSSEFGEVENAKYTHSIVAHLRLAGNQRFGSALLTICQGIPNGGDGQKFIDTEIHGDFEQLGLPVFRRSFDDDGIEYPAITMQFRDRTNG